MKSTINQYKIVMVYQLETYGIDFHMMTYMLLGKGKYVTMQLDPNDGSWFPLCGENRYETRELAEAYIVQRHLLDDELEALPDASEFDEPHMD